MKILIADDSATARFFCIRCLGAAGCLDAEFIEVEDGSKALEMVREQTFDLLVTDLMMPGIDGIELLRLIKSDETTASLPVIVVSSAGNPAREENSRNSVLSPFSENQSSQVPLPAQWRLYQVLMPEIKHEPR